MKTRITPILFAILASVTLHAQKETITPALQNFLQTNFMQQFQDIRIQAEAQVRTFTQQAGQYQPQDVARVQIAYDQTAQRFNQLLEMVKQDFMDTGKLKYISKYPDSYSAGLELEIHKLSDFYSKNFQQALADVTGNQMDGSPLLILLFDLVKFTGSAVSHFVQIRREARTYNDQYLNRYFIAPNRFKTWRELTGATYQDPYSNQGYNSLPNDPYGNQTDPYGNQTDPYGNQTNPYGNQTNPYGNQNTDPYGNQTNPYGNQNTDPYGNQTNPYGNQNTDPYGNQTNPYGNQNTDPYGNQTNPYGNQNTDPYGNQNTDPYGNQTNPYGNQNTDPYGNQTNPYGNQNTNPNGGNFNTNPYGNGSGVPMSQYTPRTVPQAGSSSAPASQSDAIWLNSQKAQTQESTFGAQKPVSDSTRVQQGPAPKPKTATQKTEKKSRNNQ